MTSGDNRALGKPTEQSSTVLWLAGSSAKAVDGCKITNYYQWCCTHTDNETEPWWGVDLQTTYNIAMVKVLNRGDGSCNCSKFIPTTYVHIKSYICIVEVLTADRLNNFDVMVASDVIDPTLSSDKQLCAHVDGPVAEGGWMEIYCNPPISGR